MNVIPIAGRIVDNNAEQMAEYCEQLATDLRSGKQKLSGFFVIEIDPDGKWMRRQFGTMYASTLIGYMQRSIFEICRELADADG